MKPHQKTQVKFVTSIEQAEAIGRVARERGISKQALIRESLQAATGVESGINGDPPRDRVYGFSDPNHPYFIERTARRRQKEAREKAEAERKGSRARF